MYSLFNLATLGKIGLSPGLLGIGPREVAGEPVSKEEPEERIGKVAGVLSRILEGPILGGITSKKVGKGEDREGKEKEPGFFRKLGGMVGKLERIGTAEVSLLPKKLTKAFSEARREEGEEREEERGEEKEEERKGREKRERRVKRVERVDVSTVTEGVSTGVSESISSSFDSLLTEQQGQTKILGEHVEVLEQQSKIMKKSLQVDTAEDKVATEREQKAEGRERFSELGKVFSSTQRKSTDKIIEKLEDVEKAVEEGVVGAPEERGLPGIGRGERGRPGRGRGARGVAARGRGLLGRVAGLVPKVAGIVGTGLGGVAAGVVGAGALGFGLGTLTQKGMEKLTGSKTWALDLLGIGESKEEQKAMEGPTLVKKDFEDPSKLQGAIDTLEKQIAKKKSEFWVGRRDKEIITQKETQLSVLYRALTRAKEGKRAGRVEAEFKEVEATKEEAKRAEIPPKVTKAIRPIGEVAGVAAPRPTGAIPMIPSVRETGEVTPITRGVTADVAKKLKEKEKAEEITTTKIIETKGRPEPVPPPQIIVTPPPIPPEPLIRVTQVDDYGVEFIRSAIF